MIAQRKSKRQKVTRILLGLLLFVVALVGLVWLQGSDRFDGGLSVLQIGGPFRRSSPTVGEVIDAQPTSLQRSAPLHSVRDFSRSPEIRVCLTPTGQRAIRISVDGAYTVNLPGSSRVLARADSLAECLASASDDGIQIGPNNYAATRLEITPTSSPAVSIDRHLYRGRVRLIRRPGQTLWAVNVLPLEHYLASVVDSEMPASFPEAARQAQAVVARTYALINMQEHRGGRSFDVFANSRSQKYLGTEYRSRSNQRLAGESASSRQAVEQTFGVVCTERGRLFCTYYSAVCGGETTYGDELFADASPMLRSVPCDWCRESPLYRWSSESSRSDFGGHLQRYLSQQGKSFGSLQSIRNMPTLAGRIPKFQFSDGAQTYQLTGNELRRIIPDELLHSPFCELTLQGETVTISGRGHGHGVGLCQWGARGLGQVGRSYSEILEYYYPAASLVRLVYNR